MADSHICYTQGLCFNQGDIMQPGNSEGGRIRTRWIVWAVTLVAYEWTTLEARDSWRVDIDLIRRSIEPRSNATLILEMIPPDSPWNWGQYARVISVR